MLICAEDPGLSFSNTNYQEPGSPSSRFIQVEYVPTISSIGGNALNRVANQYQLNGDVVIFPRGSFDQIQLQDGSEKPMYSIPAGITEYYQNNGTGGWDSLIYYDVTPKDYFGEMGVNYVTRDLKGMCISVPRHVILFHELCHAAQSHNLPVQEETRLHEEILIIELENGYRASWRLPARGCELVFEEEIGINLGFCL